MLSIYTEPFFIDLKIPLSPKVTSFRSLSFPTHVNTKSDPSAAFAAVSAFEPLYSVNHLSALAVVRL